MTTHSARLRIGWLAGWLCLGGIACAGPDATFAPAFGPADLDLAQCRQYVDGKAAPAEPDRVRRSLGFFPAGSNWEDSVWEITGGAGGTETVYHFLVVLKQPMEIGTLSLSPADATSKGSANGGELFCLKAGAAAAPDPARTEAWEPVKFASPAQQLRFAAMPAGFRTRAFLVKDVRVAGPARLLYLNAYRRRLQDLTAAADGGYSPFEGAADPDGIPLGKGWTIEPRSGIGEKTPAEYTLSWPAKQKLVGVFLCSNAQRYRLLSFAGKDGEAQGSAPEEWREIAVAADQDNRHDFQYWGCFYRWLSFPPLETSGLRIEASAVARGGKAVWVSGLATMADLGGGPPQALAVREKGPPFRLAARYAAGGDAALAIDDAKGRRVRNLFAQTFRAEGPAEEAWDLRDEAGAAVAPGTYTWKAIVAPQLALEYGLTPYPNIQNFFPERMPWLTGHGGEHGWLSDHSGNWACAASGSHLFFAAAMAEAGVTLIECDLQGRKLWGRHDFGAWIGVNQMAADAESLYVLAANEVVHRLDLATREDVSQFSPVQGPSRRGWRSAMAAHHGVVAFAYTGEPTLDNAAGAGVLDMDRCLPRPDGALPRLLRMNGTPPGGDGVSPGSDKPQGNGRLYLETQPIGAKPEARPREPGDAELLDAGAKEVSLDELDPRRVAVIAFHQPVALGSVVFPWPAGEGKLQFAALKTDAPYPPRADRDEDWTPFESSGRPGWNCVPAPPRTLTRALRVVFEPKDRSGAFWRLEGLRLLNRRFANTASSARVRVNSGKVSPAGEWDAARTAALAPDSPGLYVMDWTAPQRIAGLAIKEIDGATAEIDVWQGPLAGEAPIEGSACDRKAKADGWRNVATYKQSRRVSDYDAGYNAHALYMDGLVDFHETVETRAVRIRITEPWLDNGPHGDQCRRHDGRGEHGVHRKQSYCMWLDSRVCKIMGVAPLAPLGDDSPLDPMAYERIELWDGKSGKLIRELPVRPGWHGLSFAPDGELYVIEKSHELISRVDLQTGKLTPAIRDGDPSVFTIGPDGLFYVRPWTDNGKRPLLVFDREGRKMREIGNPGGVQPGLWDPRRFGNVHRMCVDTNGSLWVLESQDNPRRIVQHKTDGTFVKEILGNAHYGGGGTLDRTDSSRAFHGGVEFELDWQKHASRVRAFWGDAFLGGEPVTRACGGRVYVTTAPLTLNDRQGVGCVYLYDAKQGTVRLAAAMGNASDFAPLRRSGVLSRLPQGEVFRDYEFLWSDLNGDGVVDPAEVDFQRKTGRVALGPFDEKLGCCGNGVYYEAATFQANGVPVYRRTPAPGWPHLRLADGSWLTLHSQFQAQGRAENYVVGADGAKRWGYAAAGGVSGLSVTPWQPGLVGNQLCLIGHETAPAGDLGEFFVTSENTGQWRIWTTDGLPAGNVLYHQADPRARLLGPPDAKFGQRLDPLSAKQEHFHGFFTRTEPDNRWFAIVGFTHMSILEVKGLEKFRRTAGTFEVTAEDAGRVESWQTDRLRRRGGREPLLVAREVDVAAEPPTVDGLLAPNEWPDGVALPDNPDVTFRLAYDASSLYLCWSGKGIGPLANRGDDFRRLFKTGACLDFMVGADEKADPRRAAPVRGDQRLLIAFRDGAARIVLYQPVAPGAAASEGWSTQSPAGGVVRFDRVVTLGVDASAALSGNKDVTVEAKVPLAALGLAPKPGLRLRADWGVLTSADGHQVKTRSYWSNVRATGTADEPTEARLEPAQWGTLEFR